MSRPQVTVRRVGRRPTAIRNAAHPPDSRDGCPIRLHLSGFAGTDSGLLLVRT